MIKSIEVKVYQDRLYCDECGEEMQFTGMALTTYPMQYPHVCPKCGNRTTKDDVYPKIRYETIGETSTKFEETSQDDTYQIDIKVIRPIDSINFTCVLEDIKDVTED